MSALEVAFRIRQTLQAQLELRGIGLARPPIPSGRTGKTWLESFPVKFQVIAYQNAADRILAGHYNIFALRDANVGFPPRWNRDFKTGIEAPRTFGKLIDCRDPKVVGDIKYLWEPNRHLELVTLAQAWHLTGDERYQIGCRDLLTSWFNQCPYPLGPNWSSSLEVAVRLLNWSFAWQLLGGLDSSLFEGSEGQELRNRWCCVIYQHCHFIASHFSRHSSANNHLFGELTGLFVAAVTWPFWPDSGRWRNQAMRELEHEVSVQNFPDGVNREQATWYHHEVADMMLIAGVVGRANACDFSGEYWRTLEAMLEFIASIMDVSGNVPAIGDSDDAMMLRLSPAENFNVFRSLLAAGAVIFQRADFRAKAQDLDDKTRWLLGDLAAEELAKVATRDDRRSLRRSFPDAGYFILGGQLGTRDEVLIVADAGSIGFLSIAAHGHADALSFTVSTGGREMLIDPGTYSYHCPMHWREYFRGTSAHNTVRIDGKEQSVSGGRFLWLKHANARVTEHTLSDNSDRLTAIHDGYTRLRKPVQCSREWVYSRTTRCLTVTDSISGKQYHTLEMFWHFGADCEVSIIANRALARNGDVSLVLEWPNDLVGRLARGETEPPLGWISLKYDSKQPCFTLVVSGDFSGNWQGVTKIWLLDGTQDPGRL